MSWKDGHAVQSAIRAKIAQDRLLDQGNFRGALGLKCSTWPSEGGFFPRPAFCQPDRSRVWVFGN